MNRYHADDENLGDEISSWIRRHPEVWFELDTTDIGEPSSIEAAVEVAILRVSTRRRPRRRRLIGGTCIALGIASGAIGAAAFTRQDQPGVPEAGAACRAEPRIDASAIIIAPGEASIERCRKLWELETFPLISGDSHAPDLVACVGTGGALEIFPGEASLCGALNLRPADSVLNEENLAVVAVQDRLVAEINAPRCLPVADGLVLANVILADSQLAGWKVSVKPGSTGGNCGKAAIDSTRRSIVIINQG